MTGRRNVQVTLTGRSVASQLNEWHAWASCAGLPVEWWFPPKDERISEHARLLCYGCAARADCTLAGLDETDGFWGGLSPKQRRPLVARRDELTDDDLEAAWVDADLAGGMDPGLHVCGEATS